VTRQHEDPFGSLTHDQMFQALATVKAMARQNVLNGDGFPIALDEFDTGIDALRRRVDAIQQAEAWADYRKIYAVPDAALVHAHKAFKAGWEAARGKSLEEGPLR